MSGFPFVAGRARSLSGDRSLKEHHIGGLQPPPPPKGQSISRRMPEEPTNPTPATPPAPAPGDSGELVNTVKSLIEKFGSEREALEAKTLEDYKNREKNRQLREELESLRARLPEGSIVLQREDAALWNQLKGLKEALKYGEGKTDAILSMLKEHGELKTFKSQQERDAELQKVADATGAKLEVLKQLGGSLTYDVKEIDGKKAAYVKYEESGVQKEKEFKEYAKEHWAPFEASLFPPQSPTSSTRTSPQGGGGWVPQTPASKPTNGKSGDLVSNFLKRTNEARTGKKEESTA